MQRTVTPEDWLSCRSGRKFGQDLHSKNALSFYNLLEPHVYNKQRQGKFSSALKCGAQPGSRSLTVVFHWLAIMSRTGAEGEGRRGLAEWANGGGGGVNMEEK